jgi:EpsI family protein
MVRNRYLIVLSVVLVLQAFVYYNAYRLERIPTIKPLNTFPTAINEWHAQHDVPIDEDTVNLLKADDLLNRVYSSPNAPVSVSLFMAFFKTQRYGQSPHTPKNCLPANGYQEVLNTKINVDVPSWNGPIHINEYVVEHGLDKSMALYWYQSHNRVIASEYLAKIYLVLDAMRYHRSDTSIVRVVVPIIQNDMDGATRLGTAFIRALFPHVVKQLPT